MGAAGMCVLRLGYRRKFQNKIKCEDMKKQYSKRKVGKIQRKEWERGAVFTFCGAPGVWFSFEEAKRRACGKFVRRFDTQTDAQQWLYYMSL